jgi:hypothetical protein
MRTSDALLAPLSTLALAAAGGAVFAALGLPAPWLAGGMLGVVVGLAWGLDLSLPDRLRDAAMFVLGVSMGSGVTPATFEGIARWPASLFGLWAVVALVMVASTWAARRCFGWDRPTAVYASAPGALATVMILADAAGANMRRVVVAQSLRLFALIAVLPPAVALLQPGPVAAVAPVPPAGAGLLSGAAEHLAIFGAGLVGALACRLLRMPAPLLVGGLLGSAALHGLAVATAPVPPALLVPSFVVIGAYVALRFKGTTRAALQAELAASLAMFGIAAAVAALGALAVSRLAGLPLAEVLVAYAPGGVEAMAILAFALGLDVAYVATHHVVRFLSLALALPLLSFWVRRP